LEEHQGSIDKLLPNQIGGLEIERPAGIGWRCGERISVDAVALFLFAVLLI
jgi:hypothetical protein